MAFSRMFHVKLVALLLALIPLFSEGQKFSTTTMQVKPLPALPPRDPLIMSFIGSFQDLKGLPPGFTDWFYWTNYSRLKPKAFWDSVVAPILRVYPHMNTGYAASLKRELYNTAGLKPIRPNTLLLRTSQSHAFDLAKNTPGRLSHNSSNGAPFEQRIAKAGIQKCAAENLSLGPFNPVLSLVLLYLDEGLPDVGHRKNLLNPYYQEMGVGIATSKSNVSIVVQDFSCLQE